MDDEELTRARRALQGVDAELDLARVYAASRARAHADDGDAREHEPWAADERVEIVLRGAGEGSRRPRSGVHRARVLVWGAAAAAAAALVVGVVNIPAPRTVPGGAPSTTTSAPTGPISVPMPSVTFGATPSEVVLQATEAVARTSCGLKTRSTLGEESTSRFDDPGATGTGTPKPVPLEQEPLLVLQRVATETVLDLPAADGTDEGPGQGLQEDLALEEVAGTTMVRLRFSPPDELVPGGHVTRIDVLVDTTTWLPHLAETWAESDERLEYLVVSEFSWAPCDGPSPAATDGTG